MSGKDLAGIGLIVLALVVLGGGVYAAQILKRPKIDAATLCPLEGISQATSIIIDKTDPLSPAEQGLVSERILRERDGLAKGALISVLLLEENPQTKSVGATNILRLCNPGSEANVFIENQKRVSELYQHAFEGPVQTAINSALQQGSATSSPIAATVVQALNDDAMREVAHPKLILISDLMEHTSEGSAYDGSFNDATLVKMMGAEHQARLRQAAVEIVLFPRGKLAAKQAQARAVWVKFLQSHAGQFSGVQ